MFEPLIVLHFQHRYCPRKWGMKKKVHFYWNTSVSLVSKDQTPNGAAQTGLAVEADAVGPIFLGPTVRQPTVWSKSCRKPPAATWSGRTRTDTYVTTIESDVEEGERTEAVLFTTSEKMVEKSEGKLNGRMGMVDRAQGGLCDPMLHCIASHVNGNVISGSMRCYRYRSGQ